VAQRITLVQVPEVEVAQVLLVVQVEVALTEQVASHISKVRPKVQTLQVEVLVVSTAVPLLLENMVVGRAHRVRQVQETVLAVPFLEEAAVQEEAVAALETAVSEAHGEVILLEVAARQGVGVRRLVLEPLVEIIRSDAAMAVAEVDVPLALIRVEQAVQAVSLAVLVAAVELLKLALAALQGQAHVAKSGYGHIR
jgi:hypothetical protein